MLTHHFALIADDPHLTDSVLRELARYAPGQTRDHAGMSAAESWKVKDWESAGQVLQFWQASVILGITRPSEVALARRIVQEVSLRRVPFTLVVLASAECLQEVQPWHRFGVRVLEWPRDLAGLTPALRLQLEHPRTADLAQYAHNSLEQEIALRLAPYTPSLLPMVEKLALAARHDVTVLLTGETGTGKTYLARLIHDFSPRRKERFLIVPCGALSPNLIESELFGHVKGAFTGADRNRQGKFAAAGQGTLLLDEIDALPLEQQANLLRVVETGEYEPVGSNETFKSQCRLIVASNRNLREEVERGKFREDLYYRLNVMSFHLPPLRERLEDIEPLVRNMAARFCARFHKELFDISSEALSLLETYHWPGNVRELENAIQHAVLVSRGAVLLPEHLPETVRQHVEMQKANGKHEAVAREGLSYNRELLERTIILRALSQHGFSRTRAAHELGISRVTLYKKMKKYGLLSPPIGPPAQS
ncbi:MAG: sigma-54 dependent transcriptional regulator [Gemmatales bacterium]|nr:sigma-54 dependent transcriptional regulator [Gemmatales bacterium]MDW8175924.1 sigma-54 dependent transcriptional regulator [Gemmatales bacterium]